MNEICQNAEIFLKGVIADFKYDLDVSSEWYDDEGCLLNLSGDDVGLVLSENGEMLDAFETILFQVYGREIERQHRFICDADGFRQTRKSELHAMANFAAKNVRDKGISFTFGVLNSTERRTIHLALQGQDDLITESIGEGSDRRLKIKLK